MQQNKEKLAAAKTKHEFMAVVREMESLSPPEAEVAFKKAREFKDRFTRDDWKVLFLIAPEGSELEDLSDDHLLRRRPK